MKESIAETKEGTGIEWKKTNEFKEMKNEKKKNEDKKEEEMVPYKKPYRFCVFCKKMCSKLTDHIKNCHKELEVVKKNTNAEKKRACECFSADEKIGDQRI
ncbi:uncharacterized protein LOC130649461 [Hydractinia symbiolongicarpus]|uniref:uncharacterized protein LOC130649461 n=1 Tax=Hydractinia symbiolongicarpus TaxID=13093 RepID=UPI00254AFD99|nr:uncharacterized protein LOC130649461 [Hydractinia symbiolongicarpus]